jgi:hypothetical protein
MFDLNKNNSTDWPRDREKTNLSFSVLVLGVLSIISVGIIAFTLFKGMNSDVFAAAGIYKTLNYQGKLQDADGITVADGAYNIEFTIYDAAAAGNVLWSARESDACGAVFNPSAKSVTVASGVFSTQLGESGDCPLNLDFNSDSYYLGVTVGADSEMTPRKRLGASGYAFNADLLDGLNTSLVGGASSFVPATDASGNLVLTANITFDTNTFFLDSTNDNIGIGTAAPDIARTLDLTTTKKYGIYSVTSSTTGSTSAVYGSSTATGGLSPFYGGYFTAAGNSGIGVYGYASATSFATNYGVYGQSDGDTGIGVRGLASGTGGANYAGYFWANGSSGYGVYGRANSGTGTTYGVYGEALSSSGWGGYFTGGLGLYASAARIDSLSASSAVYTDASKNLTTTAPSSGALGYWSRTGTTLSPATADDVVSISGSGSIAITGTSSAAGGRGVYGTATDATAVANYGGYFTAAGTGANAAGVSGTASATGAVTNYGGFFTANGDTGYGVRGFASASGAVNYGGYFRSDGDGGYGVYGWNTRALGTSAGYGGFFRADSGLAQAVRGEATYDLSPTVNYGGYFTSAGTGTGASGVYGTATATGAVTNYGGYFLSAGGSGGGVYGEASASGAVTNVGVYGTAAGDTGWAVAGVATGTGVNYGGKFRANGVGGYGVYGYAADTSLATNYGGYFRADGSIGRAVYGAAVATGASANYGGYFTAAGTGASTSGVRGEASGTGAVTNYGGYFSAAGDTGRAVFGEGSASGAVTNYGGYFSAVGDTGIAVYGSASTGSAAVNYGGQFYAYGQNGRGVYGQAAATGAFINYGGVFDALGDSGVGVYGTGSATGAVTNYGGYFTAAGGTGRGVYGEASATGAVVNYGGYFTTAGDSGTAVYGAATSAVGTANNVGGYFTAAGGAADAYGVVATVTGGGNNFGIYASTISATGWAGFFNGGKGIYADRFSINDGVTVVDYNTIGPALAGHVAAGEITDENDLFINGNLEVNNPAWFDGGHTDLAEMMVYSGEGEAGDVIVVDENNDNSAKIATRPYDQSILGIISTKPTLIITGDITEGKLMAVAGRVPTKVTNINGAIHRGDLVTTSSIPGHAMKATETGPTVGKALGECDESSCVIWVFLNVSWYGGTVGAIPETLDILTADLDLGGYSIINVKKIIGQDEKWSIDENGVLKVKLANEGAEKEMFGLTSDKVEMIMSGSSRLENGVEVIDLSLIDENFIKNISAETPLKIFVTASEESNGLFVSERSAASFTVRELRGGNSGAAFDWIVVARRRGYDDSSSEVPFAPPSEPAPSEPVIEEPAPAPE